MSDPLNITLGDGVPTGDGKPPKRVRKPTAKKTPAAKAVKSAAKSTSAKSSRRERRPALPEALTALIGNYVDTKTTTFNRVNKGALTSAVTVTREKLIADAIASVDEAFISSNAGGLLD